MSALSISAVTGLAGPVSAETAAYADTRGDIAQGADIRTVRVVNGEKRLRVTVRHRDLVRSFRSGSSLSVFIDTDRARRGPEFVFTGGTFEGADYALLEADDFEAADNRRCHSTVGPTCSSSTTSRTSPASASTG